MKTPIHKLSGVELDRQVARVEHIELDAEGVAVKQDGVEIVYQCPAYPYSPSTMWIEGGPIIERERIDLHFLSATVKATMRDGPLIFEAEGQTPLEAAMRCFVACKVGEIED